jgi:hypothetical protein
VVSTDLTLGDEPRALARKHPLSNPSKSATAIISFLSSLLVILDWKSSKTLIFIKVHPIM